MTCSICIHPKKAEIDQAIISGVSVRDTASRFNVGHMSIQRHKKHLPKQAIEAAGRDRALQLVTVVDQVISDFEVVRHRFAEIADKAAALEDVNAEISAMREVRVTMTDALRAKGMWAPATAVQVNINAPSLQQSPEWPVLLRVLDRHPEIRDELNDALREAGL